VSTQGRARDLAIEGRTELTAELQRITYELQQSHESELARRQAAAQAAAEVSARYAQTQQIINNMHRPVFNELPSDGLSTRILGARQQGRETSSDNETPSGHYSALKKLRMSC